MVTAMPTSPPIFISPWLHSRRTERSSGIHALAGFVASVPVALPSMAKRCGVTELANSGSLNITVTPRAVRLVSASGTGTGDTAMPLLLETTTGDAAIA